MLNFQCRRLKFFKTAVETISYCVLYKRFLTLITYFDPLISIKLHINFINLSYIDHVQQKRTGGQVRLDLQIGFLLKPSIIFFCFNYFLCNHILSFFTKINLKKCRQNLISRVQKFGNFLNRNKILHSKISSANK